MDANFAHNFNETHLMWKWTESTAFEPFFIFDLPATVEIIQTMGDAGATSAPTWHRSVSGDFPSSADTARAIDFEIQISELSFSESFALTLISIWLEAIGTELSWTITAHTLELSRSQKSQAINYRRSEWVYQCCCLFSLRKSFIISEKLFSGDFGANCWKHENFNFDARRREQLAKSKCQAMKTKLIRKFIFFSPPAGERFIVTVQVVNESWGCRSLFSAILPARYNIQRRWELTFSLATLIKL